MCYHKFLKLIYVPNVVPFPLQDNGQPTNNLNVLNCKYYSKNGPCRRSGVPNISSYKPENDKNFATKKTTYSYNW